MQYAGNAMKMATFPVNYIRLGSNLEREGIAWNTCGLRLPMLRVFCGLRARHAASITSIPTTSDRSRVF